LSAGIVVVSNRLNGVFFKKIGNVGDTSFWQDTWVGPQTYWEVSFQDFSLFQHKRSVVSWRLVDGPRAVGSGFSCEGGTSLCGRRNMLVNLSTPIHLSSSIDEWKCHTQPDVCSRIALSIIIWPVLLLFPFLWNLILLET
jgi:hypothetical protein